MNMNSVPARIARADHSELESILQAIRKRHEEMYPDWDLMIVSLKKDTIKMILSTE